MQSKLVLLALAASVSAHVNYMAAMPVERDELNLLPRQTLDSKCLSAAQQIASSLPTPPPAIVSEVTNHPVTDPCHFSVPASLSKEFSSYESELQSFASKNKDLLDACTELSQFNTITVCGKVVTNGAGATTATKTTSAGASAASASGSSAGGSSGGSSGSASGSSGSTATGSAAGSQSTSTKNAGARETGMAMAAVAAAGFALAAL
ncbi:hypothetical protein TOPH_02960 [Tolypocladium ophioglossoides CBS 100239]|uniref:Infection structure specific protein n=1 Tax=Tolypocladium ophioglossoides (strain CBS 100239) TaxID=1163406 RepID=A0A0L0NEH1_TOLOC|nr:hypothetical protein TOPH_02960 [Tolypocladium ophioglossoides CBS 100239]